MKKLLLSLFAVIVFGFAANAQMIQIQINGGQVQTSSSDLTYIHNAQSNGAYGMKFTFSYNASGGQQIYTKLSIYDTYGNFVKGNGIGGYLDFRGSGTLTTYNGRNGSTFFVGYNQISPFLTPRVNYVAQMYVFDAQTNQLLLSSDKVKFYLDLK